MDLAAIPAVELLGLTKRYGPVVANAGVNLKVLPGTIHGVIGENGAGKSTAMKMLYGMFPPDSGKILLVLLRLLVLSSVNPPTNEW